jgi:hypothetical protein
MTTDDLEIAVAAGLDVPTAIALTDKPRRSRKGLWLIITIILVYWLTCAN